MYYYYPHYQNNINGGQDSWSVEPSLQPVARSVGEFRQGRAFTFNLTGRRNFEVRLDLSGIVNSSSKVFVSISEIGIIGGQLKPFMGSASMAVQNVVPQDDGIVIVRGHIDWDSNLNFRLSVLVM
ncbi:hypothetical protein [Bacillus halotolerans]|uniref:hypothetical protein n=1 Tax=Bacillus halotolerans TaxID=260554 RepID=UPI0037D59ADD